MSSKFKIVFLGLSITSSWGNGHATTYRGLVRELVARGHEVLFLERDLAYYATSREILPATYGRTALYASVDALKESFASEVRDADVVVVGSYVPEGIAVGEWVQKTARGKTIFYDIDTPVTVAALERNDAAYVSRRLIPKYDCYLSFTGGPMLRWLERRFGARHVQPLYCSFDPELYAPLEREPRWDLGYMGTYSDDRQAALTALLLEPARRWSEGRFVVAGAQYPRVPWSANVTRIEHLAPVEHREFYGSQRFTLNLTRRAMIDAGYSPSVRLFEAAACGTPIISDSWPGLSQFFLPNYEIFLVANSADALDLIRNTPEGRRLQVARRALQRVLAEHTAVHRAETFENYVRDLVSSSPRNRVFLSRDPEQQHTPKGFS